MEYLPIYINSFLICGISQCCLTLPWHGFEFLCQCTPGEAFSLLVLQYKECGHGELLKWSFTKLYVQQNSQQCNNFKFYNYVEVNLPHSAVTFAWSKLGLATLSLWAFDTFPVKECVANTSLDHIISMMAYIKFLTSPMVSNDFFWAGRIRIPG